VRRYKPGAIPVRQSTPDAGSCRVEAPEFSTKTLVKFCNFARANGLNAGMSETIDALRAVTLLAGTDQAAIKFALRSILCSSPEDWSLFDELFIGFRSARDGNWPTRPNNPVRPAFSSANPGEKQPFRKFIRSDAGALQEGEQDPKAFSGASAVERFRKVDFSELSQSDLADFERLSLRLLRSVSYRTARRLRAQKHRESIDFRRTFRQSICRGGELIDVRYKGPAKERAKLVILLDVSDSMNPYSYFLLKFAYALGRHAKEIRSFIFSTLLVEVTRILRTRRIIDALRTLSTMTTGWAGGTRIGGSLKEFNKRYATALTGRRTICVMLSDGWDTGEPGLLAAELKKIRRRVSKVIWLNPLLGLKDYQPATRGIRAALPYIDLFAPAHNLESLLALEGHLRAAIRR
jgi:uncharacterized protein